MSFKRGNVHSSAASVAGGMETCARLTLGDPPSPIFVKGSWFPNYFTLFISNGSHCWTCAASPQAVSDRAALWDESVTEYLQRARLYLSHQHPESTYAFVPDGESRKISWTVDKHGTKLEWKWRCERAQNDQQITSDILNFLMDSNIKLSDEVIRKTQSFERMREETQKCLKQNEQFKDDRKRFEADIFGKFVAILNSKKAKLRELRDKLETLEPTKEISRAAGDESEDETENESEGQEEEEGDAGDSQGHPQKEDRLAKLTSNASTVKKADPDNKTNSEKASEEIPSSSVAVDSIAALLDEPTYTTGPKRRRHL